MAVSILFCFVLTLRYVALSISGRYPKTLWIFPQCLSVETDNLQKDGITCASTPASHVAEQKPTAANL